MSQIEQIVEQMREAAEATTTNPIGLATIGGVAIGKSDLIAVLSALKEAQENAAEATKAYLGLRKDLPGLMGELAALRAERDALREGARAAVEALDLGLRLVDYFARNRMFFEGSGTPATFDRDGKAALANLKTAIGEDKPKGHYGEWCRDPSACAGKGYCPKDPNCGD